jgi:hypothetical protein
MGMTRQFCAGNPGASISSTIRLKSPARLAENELCRYISGMNWLTKQEQLVLGLVVGLLLTGWAVRAYRAAHPPAAVAVQPVKP